MSGRRAAAAASRKRSSLVAARSKAAANLMKAVLGSAAGASAYAGTMHALGAKHPIHGASNVPKVTIVGDQKAVNKSPQMKGGTRRKNRKARKTVRR